MKIIYRVKIVSEDNINFEKTFNKYKNARQYVNNNIELDLFMQQHFEYTIYKEVYDKDQYTSEIKFATMS